MLRALVSLAMLQAASCADLSQNAEYVKAGIKLVGDGLGQIASPGSARQIAINALMRSVQGTDKLTPGANDTLLQVDELLRSILSDMESEKADDQAELNLIIGEMAACNAIDEAMTNALATNVSTSDDAHKSCRTDEKVLLDEDIAACQAMGDYLVSLLPPMCIFPEASKHNINEWATFLGDGLAWFTNTKTSYLTLRDECLRTTDDLTAKTPECNEAQSAYEGFFCQYKTILEQRSSSVHSCANNARDLHQNRTSRIMAISEGRGKEAIMIYHVLCLIDKLRKALPLDNFKEDCPLLTETDAEISVVLNSEVTVPEEVFVDVSPVAVYPGMEPEWQNLYDAWMPQGLHAGAGVHCA